MVVVSTTVKVHDDGAFRIHVYSPPRERDPPHVHVECTRGGEVVVRLGDKETPRSLWQNQHMSAFDAREALRVVAANQRRFLEELFMGQIRTEAKAKAARANGLKGGRPRRSTKSAKKATGTARR